MLTFNELYTLSKHHSIIDFIQIQTRCFFFLILLLSLENFEPMKNRFAFFRVFNELLVVDLALDRPK